MQGQFCGILLTAPHGRKRSTQALCAACTCIRSHFIGKFWCLAAAQWTPGSFVVFARPRDDCGFARPGTNGSTLVVRESSGNNGV